MTFPADSKKFAHGFDAAPRSGAANQAESEPAADSGNQLPVAMLADQDTDLRAPELIRGQQQVLVPKDTDVSRLERNVIRITDRSQGVIAIAKRAPQSSNQTCADQCGQTRRPAGLDFHGGLPCLVQSSLPNRVNTVSTWPVARENLHGRSGHVDVVVF